MKNISKKILEVMNGLGAVEKDKKNSFHNYKYVSDEAIVTEIRGLLIKAGLIVVPNQTYYSRTGDLTTIGVTYTIIDSESGETISATVHGEGQDKGDKSAYKAATGAEKYFLLKTFLIPTTDDPEADAPRNSVSTYTPKKEEAAANGELQTITTHLSGVKAFATKPKGNRPPGTYYKVMDSEGSVYTTFDKNLAEICKQASENNQGIILGYQKDSYGLKIVEAEILPVPTI